MATDDKRWRPASTVGAKLTAVQVQSIFVSWGGARWQTRAQLRRDVSRFVRDGLAVERLTATLASRFRSQGLVSSAQRGRYSLTPLGQTVVDLARRDAARREAAARERMARDHWVHDL